jgi:protein arginine N-methyltransferase 1
MGNSDTAGLVDFHHFLLMDKGRTEAYQKAITRAVQPGNTVLDIGAGTGVLSLFACQAGAAKVYAVETSGAVEFARHVCQGNGAEDRITFFHDAFQKVVLPDRVDVVVTDTGATFGLQGGMLGLVLDARQRCLRKGGTIIPSALELMMAPVESFEEYRRLEIWTNDLYRIDFSSVRPFAVNNYYRVNLRPENLLCDPAALARVSFYEAESTFVSGERLFVAHRDGIVHGVGGWAVTELGHGISFCNSPLAPTIQWAHSFFPLEQPVPIQKDDSVRVRISTNDGVEWRWRVGIYRGPDASDEPDRRIAEFDQSTFFGFPVSKSKLLQLSHDYVPKISRRGEAESFVLGLLRGGNRTTREIERELLRHFPDCYPSALATSAVVREIIERCSLPPYSDQ